MNSITTNIKIKILNPIKGTPLIVDETYKVKFETQTHYIIFKDGVWYGIFKNNVEVLEGE